MFRRFVVVPFCLLACTRLQAQKPKQGTVAAPAKVRVAYYIDSHVFNPVALMLPPPAQDSEATRAELAAAHRIEQTRTPQEVAAARYDDAHEDIFLYQPVMGEWFTADALPVTAALSAHLRNDSGVVDAPLKAMFKRPRPAQFDKTLHPVCQASDAAQSYPSGHAMVGYLMALALAEMVPEKHVQVLERADHYAHNRMVCGVHYASDLEASRVAAYATFGYLLATPRFQKDLAAATEEVRHKLGLGELRGE